METEIINGHKAAVRHIFKPEELKVGSRWCRADGGKGVVTIEKIKYYGSLNPWYWGIIYSWDENGEKKTYEKETFEFQSRYCLIIEEN